jgi:hypothetical protein
VINTVSVTSQMDQVSGQQIQFDAVSKYSMDRTVRFRSELMETGIVCGLLIFWNS